MGAPRQYGGLKLEGGRYQIERRLGAGSFKTVWLALDRIRDEHVAIAVLRESEDPENFRERFWNEAKVLSRLTQDLPAEVTPYASRVVEFLNFGELTAQEPFRGLFLVTRHAPGSTLRTLYKTHQLPLPLPRVLRIAQGILEALQLSHTPTAHRGPIIHRDIKPANIILGPNDDITLLDFGIAKLIESTHAEQSAVLGTLRYMAPEQLHQGALITEQADLFAVGVILHELLTGHPPWAIRNIADTLDLIRDGQAGHVPPLKRLSDPHIPKRLATLIRHALSFDAAQRPQSAWAMKTSLLNIEVSAPVSAASLPVTQSLLLTGPEFVAGTGTTADHLQSTPPSKSRNRWWWPLVALLVTSTTAVMAGWFSTRWGPSASSSITIATHPPSSVPSEGVEEVAALMPTPSDESASAPPPPSTDLKTSPVEASAPWAPPETSEAEEEAPPPASPAALPKRRPTSAKPSRGGPVEPPPPSAEPQPAPSETPPPPVASETSLFPVPAPAPPPATPLPETLTRNDVVNTVREHRTEVQRCLRLQQEVQPDLAGVMTVHMMVHPDGPPNNVMVMPEMFQTTRLALCVIKAAKQWSFPRFQGSPTPIDFPIRISKRADGTD